jgi:hypothetical protein
MSDYRNQDGTFGEMGGKVGNHSWVSTSDQSAAGINSLDSAATASMKMDAYAQQQRMKNQQYNTPYVSTGYSGGAGTGFGPNAGKNFLYLIFTVIMLFLIGSMALQASRYNQLQKNHETRMQLSDQIINAPAIINNTASEQDIRKLRGDFEAGVAVFLYKNPAIIRKLWNCGQNCVRPSTASMLKYLPYVAPESRQYYLMQVCETPGRFALGHATLQASLQGCVITNYEQFKKDSLLDQEKSGQKFNQGFSLTMMKLFGLIALFIVGTLWYIKKRE